MSDRSALYDPTGTDSDHATRALSRAARLEAKAKAQGVCLHTVCPPPALVCEGCGERFASAWDWKLARESAEDDLS